MGEKMDASSVREIGYKDYLHTNTPRALVERERGYTISYTE